MTTYVQEGVYLPTTVSPHQHRVLAHISGKKVTGVGHLAFVAEEKPASGENSFQLLLVDVTLEKDAPAEKTFV